MLKVGQRLTARLIKKRMIEFLALLTLALQESPDAYQARRYIEDFWGWPVTSELVRILDQAYSRMHLVVRRFILEWVVKNNVRFPAKRGDAVRFRIGDSEFEGVVLDVIRNEAKAIVKLGVKGKNWTVFAEDVLEVSRPKDIKGKKT